MGDDLVNQGLELFAVGDISGAVHVWRQAQRRDPNDTTVAGYLAHVESLLKSEDETRASDAGRSACAEPVGSADAEPPIAASAPALECYPFPPEATRAAGEPRRAPRGATDGWGDHQTAASRPVIEVSSAAPAMSLVRATPLTVPTPSSAFAHADLERLAAKLSELVGLDDFSGALEIAEQLLAVDPNSPVAQRARSRCRHKLLRMYEARIGGMRGVPRVLMSPGEIIWQDLDHRAGFVLSQVDGSSTCEEIADITGLDRLESYEILAKLVQGGVIAAGD